MCCTCTPGSTDLTDGLALASDDSHVTLFEYSGIPSKSIRNMWHDVRLENPGDCNESFLECGNASTEPPTNRVYTASVHATVVPYHQYVLVLVQYAVRSTVGVARSPPH
jgi:hypothetical protein